MDYTKYMMNYYCNPIKKNGDFADPFVLRFNGIYYLYATNPDIRCWSSKDLVNWEFEGATIESDTFPQLVPFAPEVVYWNGDFYMYTSPSGFGHYVLKSKSPTGPFVKATENVGHSIDGSVFIDDDGQWYFYWADDTGILGCKMKSPTEFGEAVNTGAYMHGWTEGPFVVKKNGKYYMTYTGNHYLSKGYRVNIAVSDHPLTGYVDDKRNPILIHTEGIGVGLGHSCTVIGPNLQTEYIVYHNMNQDLTRDLNIDVIALDEAGGVVLGPTLEKQEAPKSADFFDYFENKESLEHISLQGGELIEDKSVFCSTSIAFKGMIKHQLPEEGVIECNLSLVSTALLETEKTVKKRQDFGIFFGNENRYCYISLERAKNTIQILSENEKNIRTISLPFVIESEAFHCIQIKYSAQSAELFFDGMCMASLPQHPETGDKFGYFSRTPIQIAYTAVCKKRENMNEKQIENIYKTEPFEQELKANFLNIGPFEKVYLGDNTICDCEIEAEMVLIPRAKDTAGGVLFHVTEPSEGGEGDDKVLGINFLIGYSASIVGDEILLAKHRYDEVILQRKKIDTKLSSKIKIYVEVIEDVIKIFFENRKIPILEYRDEEIIPAGRAGIRAKNCMLSDVKINVKTKTVKR